MFNLIFILIGAGLFVGGQFTPNLKLCGSVESMITGSVTKAIGLGKVDIDPKIGIFSQEKGKFSFEGILGEVSKNLVGTNILGAESDKTASGFKILPLPESCEDLTWYHYLQYGSLGVDVLILISLISALVQIRSKGKCTTAFLCVLTAMGTGFVIFFAYMIDISKVLDRDCPLQKLGYSFYMLVASAVSFLISSLASCATATTRTTSTINYVV